MADLGFLPGVTRILAATPAGRPAHDVQRDPRPRRRHARAPLPPRRGPSRGRRVQRSAGRHDAPRVRRRRHRREDGARPSPRVGPRPPHPVHPHQAPGEEARQVADGERHPGRRPPRQPVAAGARAQPRAFGADPAKGGVRVLVATDVAARGVHVDDVELVVHVDPPMEHKAYLHRSGRTARAGAEGVVVTVALDAQRGEVKDLLRKASVGAALEPRLGPALLGRRARRRAGRARHSRRAARRGAAVGFTVVRQPFLRAAARRRTAEAAHVAAAAAARARAAPVRGTAQVRARSSATVPTSPPAPASRPPARSATVSLARRPHRTPARSRASRPAARSRTSSGPRVRRAARAARAKHPPRSPGVNGSGDRLRHSDPPVWGARDGPRFCVPVPGAVCRIRMPMPAPPPDVRPAHHTPAAAKSGGSRRTDPLRSGGISRTCRRRRSARRSRAARPSLSR